MFLIPALPYVPEFPEILPPPPGPGCALLGPMNFSISLEKCPTSDSTSNCTCDIYDITSCSIGYTASKYLTDQCLNSCSSTSSSVSGTYSDFLSFEDFAPVIASKGDCEDIYSFKEVMDGKEVITITTSNTSHSTNTLSVSTPASVPHFSTPYTGLQTASSLGSLSKEQFTQYTPKPPEHTQDSGTSAARELSLLTPEAFLSESPFSPNSRHIPDELSIASALLDTSDIYEKGSTNGQAGTWASTSQQENLKLTPKTLPTSCKISDSKDFLNQLGVLKTPRKSNSQDSENISDSTASYGQEMDMICNLDDAEQDLKNMTQLEEEEQKEAERQSRQKLSLYDMGRLPPIGVFWDIENCQVCVLVVLRACRLTYLWDIMKSFVYSWTQN